MGNDDGKRERIKQKKNRKRQKETEGDRRRQKDETWMGATDLDTRRNSAATELGGKIETIEYGETRNTTSALGGKARN